jgi:hypothetical protein
MWLDLKQNIGVIVVANKNYDLSKIEDAIFD